MAHIVDTPSITADAVTLQERDDFCETDWLKVLAPAKVNLHLAIGERRPDGYHNAATVMHALSLHDVVYLRLATDKSTCHMVAGDPSIQLPKLSPDDNIAMRAIAMLSNMLDLSPLTPKIELRIEKHIPAQAGLGGGSSNAAAALVGAANLWGIPINHPAIEQTACLLGADVAFFLHGGCAYLEGNGDTFVHALEPSKQPLVLVKPSGGVSTAEAYCRFDDAPLYISNEQAIHVATVQNAKNITLFNNLAPASESIMPELTSVRQWLEAQPHVNAVLLCGSGAATFALCDSLANAISIATFARKRSWWARATTLSSIHTAITGSNA